VEDSPTDTVTTPFDFDDADGMDSLVVPSHDHCQDPPNGRESEDNIVKDPMPVVHTFMPIVFDERNGMDFSDGDMDFQGRNANMDFLDSETGTLDDNPLMHSHP
jgi:hypothetical protein